MANRELRLSDNVPGDVFVDSTCIDCDTCRWMAPETFDRAGSKSRVHAQPEDEAAKLRALQALISCPTASIGATEKHDMAAVVASFPILRDERGATRVYHCGYHSEDSFGAASWLVVRPGGNVLVDSPRFAKPLVRQIEALGGVATMFLTHRDDVADHVQWAAHFGAERVLHERDLRPGTQDVERKLSGEEPVALGDGLLAIPVPGHTEGSTCLLVEDRWFFSGDHLAWRPSEERLIAFRRACWYDWGEQQRSMARLLDCEFEWVLPGHGAGVQLSATRMREELERCLVWMAAAG